MIQNIDLVVTLSTQDNAKLLQQSKSGFKKTINWNKYLSKVSIQAPNSYLDYLIDPSFQGVNSTDRTVQKKYYLRTIEMKDYNIMIDGQNFFDQPVKNDLRTYENIREILIGLWDDYTSGCQLDYSYFSKYFQMTAKNLSEQQGLESVPKTIQHLNKGEDVDDNTIIFFIIKERNETILDFSQGTVRVL